MKFLKYAIELLFLDGIGTVSCQERIIGERIINIAEDSLTSREFAPECACGELDVQLLDFHFTRLGLQERARQVVLVPVDECNPFAFRGNSAAILHFVCAIATVRTAERDKQHFLEVWNI